MCGSVFPPSLVCISLTTLNTKYTFLILNSHYLFVHFYILVPSSRMLHIFSPPQMIQCHQLLPDDDGPFFSVPDLFSEM